MECCGRLFARVLCSYVLATDGTGLMVLDRKHSQNIVRGTMWNTVGDDRDVVFHYTPTAEGAAGPWEFLKDRSGYIQADASSTFDRLFNGKVSRATEVGCWAHARRKFEALRDVDCRVAHPLNLISRLYRFEELADLKGLDPEARAALRSERSRPELDKLLAFLAIRYANEPPSSPFAKACAYTINHREALGRFLGDGRLHLDNNICEQQMRAVALGRRNFLFAGSHEAAGRAADLYSLTRTCALRKVPVLPYFTDILSKLGDGWPDDCIEELTPDHWLELHGAKFRPDDDS